MRLQLIVSGFNRCLRATAPTIVERVVKPLRKIDRDLQCALVVSRTHRLIENPWSKEFGYPERNIPAELEVFGTELIEQDHLDAAQRNLINKLMDFARPPTEQDQKIVHNLVRYLGVLDRAHRHVDESADFIFHVRPDLYWHRTLDIPGLFSPLTGLPTGITGMMTASWGGGKSPNDRFALLSREAVGDYFRRLRRLEDFLKSGQGFSGENFLAFAMSKHRIMPWIATKASRVRIDGVLGNEKFKPTLMPR